MLQHKFACGKDAGEYLWGKHSKFYIMRNAIDTCRFKYSRSNKKRNKRWAKY